MSEHIAPEDALSPEDRDKFVGALTADQRLAIALTLEDLRGWATLHGRVRKFDSATGTELPATVKIVGLYDRRPRPALPPDWEDLFIRLGWLDTATVSGGMTVWKPTAAGLAVRDEWLPDHIRNKG